MNDRQRKFLDGLVAGLSREDAYQAAYPASQSREAATARAHQLLQRPELRAYLARREAEARSGADVGRIASRDEILRFLTAILRTPAGAVDGMSAICERFHATDTAKEVRLPPKIQALYWLIRMLGWDHCGTPTSAASGGITELSRELERRAAASGFPRNAGMGHPAGLVGGGDLGENTASAPDNTPPAPPLGKRGRPKRWRPLSESQRLFVEHVLAGMEHSYAYGLAYPRAAPRFRKSPAARLLRNPVVREYLLQRRAEIDRQTMKTAIAARQEILEFLTAIIRTPVGAVDERSRLCQAFKGRQARMPGKLAAVGQLVKLMGWDHPPKVEEKKDEVLDLLERIRAGRGTLRTE